MALARKNIFVDGSVQGSLVKRIIIHWSAFFTLVTVCIFAAEWLLGGWQLSFSEQLAQVWTKYAFFFLLVLAALPTFVYDTLKMSNRFAGPISRLKSSLKMLAEGETVQPLKFREGDYWRELSDDFNRVQELIQKSQSRSGQELS